MDLNIYKEAAKARGFYDVPFWDAKETKPVYFDLFNWDEPSILGNGNKAGRLKEELFDTESKKIVYLQGIFEEHNLKENKIYFANSSLKVDRCKKWLNQIAYKYLLSKGFAMGVKKHIIEYYIPICHTVEIEPEVVKFIQEYKCT